MVAVMLQRQHYRMKNLHAAMTLTLFCRLSILGVHVIPVKQGESHGAVLSIASLAHFVAISRQ